MGDATGTPEILQRPPAGRVVLWSGEVATLAGVTVMTISRWAREGRLAFTTTAGGNRRYSFAAVAALLADIGRPVPWWLNAAVQAQAQAEADPEALAELAASLSAIEDWLRQDCSARHAEDMADVIRRAWSIVDDLADAAGAR